ncbi:MAG: uracil-DNA glycosylase [Acidobacteria bacterium]|nr:uracil-DNA glycosylase [Acidobacteriota bacterium]
MHRPRSTRDPCVRQQRKQMLHLPHMIKLTEFAADLRNRGLGVVPDFDPLDGGVGAQILFLFEKPGPMTAEARGGLGFISRNNDDPTAEATFNFMAQAGIPRKLTVIWNVVPWWNDTRKVTGAELAAGVACVRELMAHLPSLASVVMVGTRAARARPFLESTGLVLFRSPHPSPLVRTGAREKWNSIPGEWSKAMSVVAH